MFNSGRGSGKRGPSLIFSKEPIKHEPIKVTTMNVKLNADYRVCRDGIHQEQFTAGQVVELPEHIVKVLVADGRAAVPETEKAEKGAPENKALAGAPENKGGENLGPGRKKRRS